MTESKKIFFNKNDDIKFAGKTNKILKWVKINIKKILFSEKNCMKNNFLIILQQAMQESHYDASG